MQIAARPGAAHWLKLERGGTLFTWAAAARPAGLGWCCPSRGWTDTPRHARRGGAWSLPRSPWGEPKNTLVSRELESDARRSGKIKHPDLLPLAFFQEGGENEVKTGRGEMIFDFFFLCQVFSLLLLVILSSELLNETASHCVVSVYWLKFQVC